MRREETYEELLKQIMQSAVFTCKLVGSAHGWSVSAHESMFVAHGLAVGSSNLSGRIRHSSLPSFRR